ncbi:MAG: hypothetical protein JXP73_10095 [Deltaproteobacteria bacterium]|nr:hypothetical protein [Deltaproteobacteria bacterium]
MRRILLALTVSIAVHLLLVAAAVGFGVWRSLSLVPALKVQPITVDVEDLPLGAPPHKPTKDEDERPARTPRPRHRVASARDGVTIPGPQDAGAEPDRIDAASSARPYDGGRSGIDGGRRLPGDLRENGPEGSRLIAVLRLDRLRASADRENTVAAIDQLLLLLPDRRRLIEGSGLDLYRDFDSLIVATPNPADAAVTFLAVRHHLTEAALKAGLDRGAKAAHKPIAWQTIGGRPVGLRRRPTGPATTMLDRDDRIIALPLASLAIMATPAYATQLLDVDPTARPDGGIDAGARGRKPVSRLRWQTVAARIEGEENAVPDDAVFLMMATGLFPQPEGPAAYVVPPTRGASADQPPLPVGEPPPPPQTLTVLVGLQEPYIEVSAEFPSVLAAKRWEKELPSWRRKLLLNPAVILGGAASLIARAENSREDNTLRVHANTSTEELQRLLNLAATLIRAAQAPRR